MLQCKNGGGTNLIRVSHKEDHVDKTVIDLGGDMGSQDVGYKGICWILHRILVWQFISF